MAQQSVPQPVTYKKNALNTEGAFDWKVGSKDSSTLVKSRNLNIVINRYWIISKDNDAVLYDTIGIKEPETNATVLLRNQHGKFGLIKEWRPVPESFFWATPRGMGIDQDTSFLDTARREVTEEIGFLQITAEKILGRLNQNSTFFESSVGVVLLDVDENSIMVDLKRFDEALEFEFFSLSKIKAMISMGEIWDAFTLGAFAFIFSSE